MSSTSHPRRSQPPRQQGYVMLMLLLALALMAIFVGAILPQITFEIKRDREEEMIHRGVQYSRAIRLYYKKFGRYPTRIEELESSNNLRFLRKRYKDPITGQDFKLLHFGEVKMSSSMGIGGGSIPGANGLNGQGGLNGQNGQQSAFGGNNSLGGNNSFGNSNSSFGNNSSSFGNSNSNSFGNNNSPRQLDPSQPMGGDPTQSGSSSNGTSTQNGGSTPGGSTQPNSGQPGSTDSNGAGGDKLAGQTFGGGPVVGVASGSKKDTIREFNHKKKYNEWQFIYDPATDRGGLLTTPNQPQLQQGLGGQPGVQNGNGTGNNGSFGGTLGEPPPGMMNGPALSPNPQQNPPQQ